MPFFSVVVPAYNNGRYLRSCLESIADQEFIDWEAIIVNDGSSDETKQVLEWFADQDARFQAINKLTNDGTHLARKDGVLAATGDFLLFLDADDTLFPNALSSLKSFIEENPSCDIFRFGTTVQACGMSEADRLDCEQLCNPSLNRLKGEEIAESSFIDPVKQDWRVLQRVYRRDLVQKAFENMDSRRFGRGQDSYECFVISALAECQVTDSSLKLYCYHLGRGITSNGPLSLEAFSSVAYSYSEMINATKRWVHNRNATKYIRSFEGYCTKLAILLSNDWAMRVADSDKIVAADIMKDALGPEVALSQIMRLSRDAAYDQWVRQEGLSGSEPFLSWVNYVEEAADSTCQMSPGFIEYASAAKRHIDDLKSLRRNGGESFLSRIKRKLFR